MCGICGYLTKDQITMEQLKNMNDLMYHRGPNDSGEEIFPLKDGYSLGFAQRRLSIVELSALGHQPMHTPDGRISIIFNGEIYNFLKLREELADYSFCSNSDTEVILAAYRKWGIDCISHFNGMFAFALYDRELETLYLTRDRVGKKPLYYTIQQEGIIFASELKPIMAYPGFQKEIDTRVISRFLYQQYIASPDSIFKNVHKLEPGSVLTFHKGTVDIKKYWSLAERYQKMKNSADAPKTYTEALERLKDTLTEAVRMRMIADVPLGAFLSGGYDSSLVTAIAQSISKEPVKTYSIGFHEEKYNEAGYAGKVAEYLGTNHTERYISEQDMFRMVDSIAKYYDEPFADSSQIPTMLVSEVAVKDITVVLSGDGGDEFFCGYNVYEDVALAQKIDWLGAMTHTVCRIPGLHSLENKLPYSVRTIAKNRDKATKTQFGGENYISMAEKMVLGEHLPGKFPIEQRYREKNWQERRMLTDMDTYLTDDILCKVDRASMKYSLEARCPILDVDVMELSFAMKHSYKYKNGIKKRILKDLTCQYLPKELMDRPKVGFGVPLDQWLRGPLKARLLDMSAKDSLKAQGIFDPSVTNQFVTDYLTNGDGGPATGRNYSKVIWPYFIFQQWYDSYFR